TAPPAAKRDAHGQEELLILSLELREHQARELLLAERVALRRGRRREPERRVVGGAADRRYHRGVGGTACRGGGRAAEARAPGRIRELHVTGVRTCGLRVVTAPPAAKRDALGQEECLDLILELRGRRAQDLPLAERIALRRGRRREPERLVVVVAADRRYHR